MNESEKRINAIACAIRVMDGTAGGYTQEEIADNKNILLVFLGELEKNYLKSLQKG